MKISSVIICNNEEKKIADALNSLLWTDEIIVVDSYSTDNTPGIIKKHFPQVKFFQREFTNHANQKNWAIDQCSHDWVFILDSDEVATRPLIQEIKNIALSKTDIAAFWIYRQNYVHNRPLKKLWKNDKVIRLINKKLCRYKEVEIHEEITTQGKISFLNKKIAHYAVDDWYLFISKQMRYARAGSRELLKQGIKPGTFFHLAIKPGFRFFRQYILKGGFLDGQNGLIICCVEAFTVFMKYVMLQEYKKSNGAERMDNK